MKVRCLRANEVTHSDVIFTEECLRDLVDSTNPTGYLVHTSGSRDMAHLLGIIKSIGIEGNELIGEVEFLETYGGRYARFLCENHMAHLNPTGMLREFEVKGQTRYVKRIDVSFFILEMNH